jgi:hypothetical protein
MNDTPRTLKQLHGITNEHLDTLNPDDLIRLVEDLRQQNGLLWAFIGGVAMIQPRPNDAPDAAGYNAALSKIQSLVQRMLAGGE